MPSELQLILKHMEGLRQESFIVGDWHVHPSDGLLTHGDETVRLEPKAMDVLVYLAKHPEVVSREDLEREVWRGAIVGYDAVTNTIIKLRKAFGDSAKQSSYIATVPKRGYRLVAPVTFLPNKPEHGVVPTAPPSWRIGLLAMLALTLILLTISGVYVWQSFYSLAPIPPHHAHQKALAVLPFRNLSDDPAQDYFAEGLSDDLISLLSRFSDLQVIARDTTIHYKGKTVSHDDLATALDIGFLVEGSVRRDNEKLRVNVQLMDSHTSIVLWSESFDDDLVHLFELQDKITHRVVVAVTGRINVQDRQELGPPKTHSLQAYDHFLYGRQQFFLYASAEKNRKARDSFSKAIEIDPSLAIAYAMLAWTHAFDAINGWSKSRETSLKQAKSLALRAIELDEAMPVAYFVRGLAYREMGQRDRALIEAEKAISFDPNYAGAHVLKATLLYFNGQPQQGLELMKRAISLNPHHPFNYSFHLGQAHYVLHQYIDAIEAFSKVLASNPSFERARLWLAAAYAQAGKKDDAGWEVEQVLTTNPQLSVEQAISKYPFTISSDNEHFREGLIKAGVPPFAE